MLNADDIYAGTLIDVRTPEEFDDGHHPHAINIPLDQVAKSLERIKSIQGPIYLCCQSGGRSGNAARWLTENGVTCMNVGGWASIPK